MCLLLFVFSICLSVCRFLKGNVCRKCAHCFVLSIWKSVHFWPLVRFDLLFFKKYRSVYTNITGTSSVQRGTGSTWHIKLLAKLILSKENRPFCFSPIYFPNPIHFKLTTFIWLDKLTEKYNFQFEFLSLMWPLLHKVAWTGSAHGSFHHARFVKPRKHVCVWQITSTVFTAHKLPRWQESTTLTFLSFALIIFLDLTKTVSDKLPLLTWFPGTGHSTKKGP